MCAVDASGRYDDSVKRQNVVPASDKECVPIVPQGLGCLERSREKGQPAAEGVVNLKTSCEGSIGRVHVGECAPLMAPPQ
ncbi:unnamed protein product, partial [Toxocara canis]|uniref:Uncharacterized protein n=1 Tax=Toxocara canis TaxID=6265 RepID=A0A183U9N9_TOXCA